MEKNKDINIAEVFGASSVREQRFAVYIPNKDKDGNTVEQSKWIEKTLRLLSEICGGATAMPPIRGAWLNEKSGALVVEEPVLVYTFIEPDEFAKRMNEVVCLVHDIGKETRQGQMAIEFNQTFYLIDIA
jgi:hypothetical protein